jgi:hypothetical protein
MAKKKGYKFEEVEEEKEHDEDMDDEEEEEEDEEYLRYKRKRTRLIILSILIVIIILIVAFYAVVINPQGVLDIIPGTPRETEEKDGITITADIALKGTGTAEGDGDLKIKLDGKTTYSGKISIENGVAEKTVKYKDFVEGNGDYEISISFEGLTRKTDNPFTVDWVVERVDVELKRMSFTESENLTSSDDPYFILNTEFKKVNDNPVDGTRRLDITVDLYHEEELSSFKSENYKFNKNIEIRDTKLITYNKAGNITAKVTIVNENVKSDSDYNEITGESTEFINTPPSAEGELSNGNNGIISLSAFAENGVAEFDASDSFDLDGEIVRYRWEFNDDYSDPADNVVNTKEPYATHQYSVVGTYSVILTVYDEFGYDIGYQGFDTALIDVEVVRL